MARRLIAAVVLLLVVNGPATAQKVPDFTSIRGVNYPSGWRQDSATVVRDLGYAKRLNINSLRFWLSYRSYEQNPQEFLDRVETFIRIANRLGFTSMPILFNGNGLDPATLKQDFRKEGDDYVTAVVNRLKNHPGLIMWDIMNEPEMNDYIQQATKEQEPGREAEIKDFERHYVNLVNKLDPVTATTVGYGTSSWVEHTADIVDVISYHDYMPTRAKVEANLQHALDVAKANGNKPVVNSETACIARANPYDMVLQIMDEHHVGWYVFQLMISGYWGPVHGIFYPDGTIRDPAIVAAVMGFFRNRDLETMVRPEPNREGQADRALHAIQNALTQDHSVFGNRQSPTDSLLNAAEYAANLLESAEMVPMIVPPTAQIKYWRSLPENERPREQIREFAYKLGNELKKWNQIY